MILIYNIGIRLYYLYVWLGSVFNTKARLWIRGRQNLFGRIRQEVYPGERIAWFHCSSLGEFEQGRPVKEALKSRDPELRILLTFFSPSGYEIRKNFPGADHVYYLPLDTRRNARQLIRLIEPVAVYFIKYEFWYHYMHQLSLHRIPVFLVSAIFRPGQLFFKPYGRWYRKILDQFTHIFVQDEPSRELLHSAGLRTVTVAGDTRFDRVTAIASKTEVLPVAEAFKQDHRLIIAGSTWPEDEQLLCQYINDDDQGSKYVIAPHEIHESQLKKLEQSIRKKTVRYSAVTPNDARHAGILIVDTIGILSSLYRYADLAYIGGGFGRGIHNILEAAAFGIPVVFGPNHKTFREAVEMIERGSAFSINNYEGLAGILDRLLGDEKMLQQAGRISDKYVLSNTGATEKILKVSLARFK